jgi:hypothetical protein
MYINSLAQLLPPETVNALFADDVAILASSNSIEKARELAQKTVDIVATWSKKWRLSLNAIKSEVSFFSTDPREADTKVDIVIDDAKLPFNPTPKFLGVIFGRTLSFKAQCEEVSQLSTTKLRMLNALSSTKWGCLKQDLMKVYVYQIRSKMDYAAAGWQPWLKKTNMDLLERVQNKVLRIVTENVQKTRCEAIRLEANNPAYKTLSDRNCLRAREKAVRLDVKHPRKIALDEAVEKRTGKDSWVSRSTELQKTHQIPAMGAKEPLSYFNRPPWDSPANLTINSSIPQSHGRTAMKSRLQLLSKRSEIQTQRSQSTRTSRPQTVQEMEAQAS